MMYRIQSNHYAPYHEYDWKTISSDRAGHQEFDTLERALKVFKRNCNMARCIWPMRVVDDKGFLHALYNPDLDTRLPGSRFYLVQKLAYSLWEEAGHPEGRADQFWYTAESTLPEDNGVRP